MKNIIYIHPKILEAQERIEKLIEEETFKKYEKPKIEKVRNMTFPFDSINKHKRTCRQCSSCHGCR